MKKNVKSWDPEESAVLLEGYLAFKNGSITRKEAIQCVSQILRAYACGGTIEVDAIFRNEAGITFQMASMESAYQGKTVFKQATRSFVALVDRFKKNRSSYVGLLDKVGQYLHNNDIETYKSAYKRIRFTFLDEKNKDDNRGNCDNQTVQRVKDAELSQKYPLAYSKLKKVLRDLSQEDKQGISIPRLQMAMGGMFRLSDIKDILDSCSWALPDPSGIFYLYSEKQVTHEFVEVSPMKLEYDQAEKSDNIEKSINDQDSSEEDIAYSFGEWLKSERKYVSRSVRSYVTAIRSIETFVKGQHIYQESIYGMPLKRLEELIDYLNTEPSFLEADKIQHKRLSSAISNYREFLRYRKADRITIQKIENEGNSVTEDYEFDKAGFIEVLLQRFRNGMQFDSVDIEIFRETYFDNKGENIEFNDDELKRFLMQCGVMYKDRLFPADGIIENSIKTMLMEYIKKSFAEGKSVLYYKAIFKDMSDVFSRCYNLADEKMLKAYLEYACDPGVYYFSAEYMSKERNVKVDHSAEIEDFLLSAGRPLSYEEIYTGLSHVSRDILYSVIKSNSNIILNEREHYFHYGIFELSCEEADIITDYIRNEIEVDGYCIWSRVFKRIQVNMPLFIENNVYLSSLGVRNAISKKLSGRFEFDGEVICSRGQSLNMAAVYRLFGLHHTPFSDDDIYEFSKIVNDGVIYFDSLSDTTIRVSKSLFVARNQVSFDVEATDAAISTYMAAAYMPIKEFDSFLVFPNVGYEWNSFLLESYLMYYSSKYALVNNGRSLSNVAGAVVKKGAGFDEFVEVCADVLANSECNLTKNKALDYLAEMNLLTRRSYSKIEEAITRAKQIRNKKG